MIRGKKKMQTVVIAIAAFIAGEIAGVVLTALMAARREEDEQEGNE